MNTGCRDARRSEGGSERGSVSVVVAAGAAVVLVLTMGVADVGRALTAAARARAAADAAALAAAQELALPTGQDPSSLARAYATENGADLVWCECEPGSFEALVEVTAPAGDLLLFPGAPMVTARARAVVDLPGG